MENFDLVAMRASRDAAIASRSWWALTAPELAAAYALGERNFSRADLRGTFLYHVNLRGANLRGADLRGADLRGTFLYHADLRGAKGIIAMYIPDASGRGDYLYAVDHDPVVYVKAGCFWGTLDEFRTQVRREKGEAAIYLKMADLIEIAFGGNHV